MNLPDSDRSILRELAHRIADYARTSENAARIESWKRFNALKPDRPMVLIFPEGAWREVPLPLQCTDKNARNIEWQLRSRLYTHEVLQDDAPISDIWWSGTVVHNTGWGVGTQWRRPEQATGAAHFEPVIVTEDDFTRKVRKPQVTVDHAATAQALTDARELFGDILRVEPLGVVFSGVAMIDMFAQWRGLDQLFLDMVDRPEWLHGCFQFLIDGYIDNLKTLQAEGVLGLNNGPHYISSGGVGYTDELPQSDFAGIVRPIDMWGFATTQIFSEVSPAMHEEFALRYETQWLSHFGLNNYGCCEPLHRKMDAVRQIPRLRRVSMSPWVDLARGAAELGDRIIFSRKPNPAMLASISLDESAIRRSTREDLEKTRGCVVELIMKDTHTVNQQPDRLAAWVRIAREECMRFAEGNG